MNGSKKHSKKQIIFYITLAMVLEAIIVLWPIVCAISGEGPMTIWSTMNDQLVVTAVIGLFVGLFVGLGASLFSGLGSGLVVGLVAGLVAGMFAGVVAGMFAGVVAGVAYGLASGGARLIVGLGVGLFAGAVAGLFARVVAGLFAGLLAGLGIGLFTELVAGLVAGLVSILVSVLVAGVVAGLLAGLFAGLFAGLLAGVGVGLFTELFSVLVAGLGVLIGIPLRVLLMKGLKNIPEGFITTFKGFLKPWQLEHYSILKAVVSFVIIYMTIVSIFGLWYNACYLGSAKEYHYFKTDISETFTPNESKKYNYWDFVYFSFVTITTLGYGDIAPSHWFPQALVVIETMIGLGLVVGYLGIIIYVGGQAAQSKARQNDES